MKTIFNPVEFYKLLLTAGKRNAVKWINGGGVGEKKRGSFDWSNNQIDMRQISQRKEPNLTYTCTYGNPTHMRESETPRAERFQGRKG